MELVFGLGVPILLTILVAAITRKTFGKSERSVAIGCGGIFFPALLLVLLLVTLCSKQPDTPHGNSMAIVGLMFFIFISVPVTVAISIATVFCLDWVSTRKKT